MRSFLALVLFATTATAPAAAQQMTLTLPQTVELAVKNNLQTLLAEERIAESRGARDVARSALLPNLSGGVYQMNLTANLAAQGLPAGKFPGLPAFIGPFSRFDARAQLVQSVLNFAAIRQYRAGNQGMVLARHQRQLAVQQVTTVATAAYLMALEANEAVSAAQANVQLGKRLLDLANSQKSAGVATGVDVARAETRLANQEVQLAVARTNRDTALLNLLRIAGVALSREVVLADAMKFMPEERPEVGGAVEKALAERLEIQVAEDQVRIAETQRKAVAGALLPTVAVFGDYGASGLLPNDTDLPTRSVGVRLDVPLFNGGRTRSEIQMASSRLREAELQRNDLKQAVEKDVRLALDNLATREEQVKAAQKVLSLAQRELELSQDRFKNGVADNIEVVNAQTAIENARQGLVSSLAQYNVARLNLKSALGHVEDFRL
jgi:outer membrane protein